MSFFTIATLFPSTWLQMSFLWKKWMGKHLDIVSDSFFLLNFVVTDLKPYLAHAIATHFFLYFLTKDKCITHSVLWRVSCVLWTNIFRHNSFTHSTLLCISFIFEYIWISANVTNSPTKSNSLLPWKVWRIGK